MKSFGGKKTSKGKNRSESFYVFVAGQNNASRMLHSFLLSCLVPFSFSSILTIQMNVLNKTCSLFAHMNHDEQQETRNLSFLVLKSISSVAMYIICWSRWSRFTLGQTSYRFKYSKCVLLKLIIGFFPLYVIKSLFCVYTYGNSRVSKNAWNQSNKRFVILYCFDCQTRKNPRNQ